MKKLLLIGICSLFIGSQVKAQFSLSGELRPRTEYSHGYGALAAEDQDPSLFTSQRTRLNFDYKMDLLKVGLVLQDVRIWGNQAQQVANEEKATSIHQAWAEMNLSKTLALKVGRQELAYDDARIFGHGGWNQQGRSHDVALFKYAKKVNVHFGIAHHETGNRKNNLYDGPDAYKDLQFLWINRKTDNFNLSLLFLNNGKPVMEGTEQKSKYSQTFGTHVEVPVDKVAFSGNLYFQTGEDGANQSLNAYNLMAEATYQVSEESQLLLGYEILSGSDYNQTEKNNSFNPLYGTNHKFNGFMDYFYVGNHLNNVGLSDGYVKFATSKNKTAFNADLHFFASAAKISETADNYLGTELDLTLTQTINPVTKIAFGYSQMFGTESLQILKGGSKSAFNNWAYVMISVTPKFIP
ncbi:MAG: alginate export family protein [Prolixibacteraceae bacterium]|nr:alginate export family protein [Prolixibacteraceae bacterium]